MTTARTHDDTCTIQWSCMPYFSRGGSCSKSKSLEAVSLSTARHHGPATCTPWPTAPTQPTVAIQPFQTIALPTRQVFCHVPFGTSTKQSIPPRPAVYLLYPRVSQSQNKPRLRRVTIRIGDRSVFSQTILSLWRSSSTVWKTTPFE